MEPIKYDLLTTEGKELLGLMEQERPTLISTLRKKNSLLYAIREAESHFSLRKVQHADDFDKICGEAPAPVEALARRIKRREDYINAELQREMLNWINNYPDVKVAN